MLFFLLLWLFIIHILFIIIYFVHVCVTFPSCFSFREGLKKILLKNLVSFLCEKEIEELYHIQIVKTENESSQIRQRTDMAPA